MKTEKKACSCCGVTYGDVAAAVEAGASTYEEVSAVTRDVYKRQVLCRRWCAAGDNGGTDRPEPAKRVENARKGGERSWRSC